jgi:hypothetical protein
MGGVFYWPRLYGMPEAARATLVAARGAIDTMLTLSLLAWLYLPVAAALLAANRGGLARVGVVAWRARRRAAGRHGGLSRRGERGAGLRRGAARLLDLYRHDLIKQPGYAIPPSLEDERRLWHNLA